MYNIKVKAMVFIPENRSHLVCSNQFESGLLPKNQSLKIKAIA